MLQRRRIRITKHTQPTSTTEATGNPDSNKLAVRWGKHPNLFSRPEGWVGVPDIFLRGHANLKPYALTPTEAMFILQLMAFKWSEDAPFPSYARLHRRMGVSVKQIQRIARSVEEKGYLRRVGRIGSSNRFDLQPLFDALATAQRAQAEESDSSEAAA
jgi:hypothetical protein